MLRVFSIYAVSVINLIIAIWYCWQIYKRTIQPALAMWTFFSLAVAMSLFTYMNQGSFSFWDNVLNTTDVILTISVTIAILVFGDRSTRFTSFDKGCLVAVLIIIIFWLISHNDLITNLLIQLIIVIAYFPVIQRFFAAKKNTESFFAWILMLLAPAFALLSSKGFLATVYSIRAMVCVSLLLLLMIRIEMKNKKLQIS